MKKGIVVTIVVIISVIVLLIAGAIAYPKIKSYFEKDDDDGSVSGNNTTAPQNPKAVIEVFNATEVQSYDFMFEQDELILFSGSKSQGNISMWTWDFGDGDAQGPAIDFEKINHSYEEKGTYVVTLTVMTNLGATNKTSITVTILGIPDEDTLVANLFVRLGMTNETFNLDIKEDALNMTLDFTVMGLSSEGNAKLNVGIYNAFDELMDNKTFNLLGQETASFFFDWDEISYPGAYFVKLNAEVGSIRVVMDYSIKY